MSDHGVFQTVGQYIADTLTEKGFPACVSRRYTYYKDNPSRGFDFGDKPFLHVCKDNIIRRPNKKCREAILTLRFEFMLPNSSCETCNPDEEQQLDDYVDQVHECLCGLSACDVGCGYRINGQESDSLEDDSVAFDDIKELVSTITFPLRVTWRN